MSDHDSILLKALEDKRKPDERIEYDVKPIFRFVEDTLIHSALRFDGATKESLAPAEDRSHHPGYTSIPEALSAKIEWISSEISYKILNGVEEHRTTIAVLDVLTMYKWEMKIVLALAAFTLTYGEFCLLAHVQDNYQLAKKLAILKQFPSIMENASSLKPRFDTLNDLVKITLEVTKCVIEVQDLPTEHATANDYIPIVCYWTIRSIVACTTQITSLTNGYAIFSSTDTWELSKLTLKLENIINYLRQLADSGSINITTPRFNLSAASASVMHDEAYERLRDIFSKPQNDNVKVLEALINAQDVDEPLYDDRSLEKTVKLEELRWKTVLLLISGLEFSALEIEFLSYLLREGKREGKQVMYGLVWIPIVDPDSEWTEAKEKRFQKVVRKILCYSVRDPSLIGKPIISFIEKEWKYRNKPIMVVLDPQGNVSCFNAIHMIWLWGSHAFPFTISAEDVLWKKQSWDISFLLDESLDLSVYQIGRAEYAFLYGGNDLEWIRRFVDEARRVQIATKINLEMLYVGKSNNNEQMEEIIKKLDREKLNTAYWPSGEHIWVFWLRLQSILFSKLQVKQIGDNNPQMQDIEKLLGKEDDNVMDDIKKILSYDKCGGWILLAKGYEIVMIGNAETGLQTLVEYDDMWREHVSMDGFANAFKNHYNKVRSVVSSCCKFEFSPKIEKTSELFLCPECHDNMHAMTTFQCCHNEETYEDFFF